MSLVIIYCAKAQDAQAFLIVFKDGNLQIKTFLIAYNILVDSKVHKKETISLRNSLFSLRII